MSVAARGPRDSLSRRGWLLILLIGATVFAVTILRIDRFVLAENHRDAPTTARALVAELRSSGADSLPELLTNERLRRQLSDYRLLEEDRVLERFGYLFALTRESGASGGVVAWPRRHGRSGAQAFHLALDGTLLVHANEDGRWSGPGRAPTLGDNGWRPLGDR